MPEEQDQRTEKSAEQDVEQRTETPVIESASGTTDPENSRSGGAAYVIFGLAVALLVVLCLGVSSCTSALGTLVSAGLDDTDGYDEYDLYDYYDDHHDPYEDLLTPEDDFLFDYFYDFGDDLGGMDSWLSSDLRTPGAVEGGRA